MKFHHRHFSLRVLKVNVKRVKTAIMRIPYNEKFIGSEGSAVIFGRKGPAVERCGPKCPH